MIRVASREDNWFAEVGGRQGERDLTFTVFTFISVKVSVQRVTIQK